MKPQKSDFSCYICILYKQSNIHYYLTPTGGVFRLFRIKSYVTEVLNQPRGGTPASIVIVIRDQSQANVSNKEIYWLTSALLRPTARPRSHDW